METKKSQKANLEKSRLMFTQIGLIVSLAVSAAKPSGWCITCLSISNYSKIQLNR